MKAAATFLARITEESKMFIFSPPPGVCVYRVNDSLFEYKAEITGPEDSPYEGGIFELDVSVTDRYPFEPPKVRFVTPIYHPNIDSTGRICLDLLKMPPAGNWQPSINICVLLTSIRLLMATPNPLDPLMVDISEEYLRNNKLFVKKAKERTQLHAIKQSSHKRDHLTAHSSPTAGHSQPEAKEGYEEKEKKENEVETKPKTEERRENRLEEAKRQRIEKEPEIDLSENSDSSEAEWSD